MIPHCMPEGHGLSRVLLYASPCRAHGRTSEMAVIVDAKGLAAVLEGVGHGYARAAVDLHNFCHGAADSMPWAAAYPVPADYGLFGLPDGWTKLEFVAFPTDHRPLNTKQDRWQLIEFDPEGAGGDWAPAGMVIFPERGGPVYVAHGTDDKVELAASRIVTREGMLSTAAWPAVRELADAIRQERQAARFHEHGRMGE